MNNYKKLTLKIMPTQLTEKKKIKHEQKNPRKISKDYF